MVNEALLNYLLFCCPLLTLTLSSLSERSSFFRKGHLSLHSLLFEKMFGAVVPCRFHLLFLDSC